MERPLRFRELAEAVIDDAEHIEDVGKRLRPLGHALQIFFRFAVIAAEIILAAQGEVLAQRFFHHFIPSSSFRAVFAWAELGCS